MERYKKVSKRLPFLIYGAGEVGNNCYKNLNRNGYSVVAALDKNQKGDHLIPGIMTYQIGTEPSNWDKSQYVVIICLANGMIHKEIAEQLYALGYTYLVFLPMNFCIPDKQKRDLTNLYNRVLDADPKMTHDVVYHYSQYVKPDLGIETGILRQTDHSVTVWMGLEMLFSESLELWVGDKAKIYVKDQFKDKNIAYGNPCEALFDYYALKLESCDAYFESRKVKKSQEKQKQERDQREQLYRLFKREYQKGMNFFIDGAPPVVWNQKNYCNLVGGHHRTLYLLHEGNNLFPVKMSNADFKKWCNQSVLQELKKYIITYQIKKFYAPLPHPSFLNFPSEWEDVGRTKLADVMRFFSEKNIFNMSILDCMDDEGYFARNMDRMGAQKSIFLNEDRQQIELANLFNRLLYRKHVFSILGNLETLEKSEKFDVVFCNHKYITSKPYIQLAEECCAKYLMIETETNEEFQLIQQHVSITNYICIHREYRNGEIWALWVFCKEIEN